MGNQKSKKTSPGAAVYNKKQDAVSVETKSEATGRPNSNKSVGTMTSDEEQVISVSRGTTRVWEQREGATTGSSGYASLAYGVSLTSETGCKLLKDMNESTQKEMKMATGGVDESTRKGLKMSDETRLRRSIHFIKEEIEPDPIVDCFIRDEHMSEDDRERIKQTGTRQDQIDALLCMLVRMQEEAFEKFCDYLDETKYSYVKEHILNMSDNYEIEKTTLEDVEARILKNKQILVDQLEPDAISVYMLEYRIISFEQYTMLRSKFLERTEKAEKLIKLVLDYQPKSFDVFIHALQKTKDAYCINVLENTQMSLGTVAAAASSTKIKIVREGHGAASRKVLKGVDKLELKLEFRNKDVELEIVEELNNCTVRLAINDELSEKQLVYTDAEHGSVIIRIRVLSQDKRRGIRAEFKASSILEVLNVFLKHSQTLRRFCGQVFDVKLEASRAIGKKTTKTRMIADPKITIQKNRALLEEELDALSLMEDLKLHKIFTEDEVTEILHDGNPRRRERTKRMLSKLLEKDHSAIDIFINALRRKKKDLVVNCLLENEGVSLKETGILEAEHISRMVTDMSPMLIEKECTVMGIVDINDFKIILSREARARTILQNLMAKTDEEIIRIAQVLQWYHQIPRGIACCKQKQEGNRRIKTTILHIGEFKIEKDQDGIGRKSNAKGKQQQHLNFRRFAEFSKNSTPSCSSNESGYSSHMSLDSVGHENLTPRKKVLSPLTPRTVQHIRPAESLKGNTSFSLKSLDNSQIVGRQMADMVHSPLNPPTPVALKHGDVTINQEKVAKPQVSGSLRHIVVTPVKEENLDLFNTETV